MFQFFSRKTRAASKPLRWPTRKAKHTRPWGARPFIEFLEERSMLTMLPPISYAAVSTLTAVQVGDFNSDGRADIVELSAAASTISVLLNNGDGTFQAPINSTIGNFSRGMNVADYNHDGKLDIAINVGSAIEIHDGNGDGTFQLPASFAVGASANDIETGDFNNDGFEDIVTASFAYGGTSQLFLNDGSGGMLPPRNVAISSLGLQVEVADFNGDGNLDLMENSGYATAGVLLGRGDGTFTSMANLSLGTAGRDLVFGDFNKDGKTDAAISNGATLSVLTGDGAGGFKPTSDYTISQATDLKVADLNGDGTADLITGAGQVAFGRGDGTFYTPTNYNSSAGTNIALADFNGDGSPDLVASAALGTGNGVNVMLNANNDATLLAGAVGLVVSASNNVTAGAPFSVTVSAVDSHGNVVPGFLGTVGVSGASGSQPVSYTFAAGDAGTHTIAGAASLFAAGSQTVTVTSPFLPNGSATVAVNPAAAAKFFVSAQSAATAGVASGVTVFATDAFGNLAASYRGTVHFRSSDPQASLPADYTFTADDVGSHTLAATLKSAGPQTIGAADISATDFTGTSAVVLVAPSVATSLSVVGGGGYIGSVNAVTVSARDAFGNLATGYSGVVHLTTFDARSATSSDASLTGGLGTFTVTPLTLGSQTLTAVDAANASIGGVENIFITPGWGVRFAATPLAATVAGQAQATTITVYDAFGDVSTVYTGTIVVTSSDPQAPPTYYSFGAADAGVRVIPVALKTAGVQSVTFADYVNPAVTVTQANIPVTPAAAVSMAVNSLHGVTAGVAQSVTVYVRDAYGNAASGYRGTITFNSSDVQAGLPAAYALTAADAGAHTFSLTLKTSGGQTVTVSDLAKAANLAFTSTQKDIPVTSAAVSAISIRAASNVTAGAAFSITVSMVDAFGNNVTNYTGKIHFAGPSSSGNLLPADYTFTAADLGEHIFSVTLSTAGTQSLTVNDTVNVSIKGSTSVKVVAAATAGGGGGGGGGGTVAVGGATATGSGTVSGGTKPGGSVGGGKKVV